MKITIITTLAGPGPIAGGVWEVALLHARALLNEGHSVRLLAGWLGQDGPTMLRDLPVELIPARIFVPPLGIRSIYAPGWSSAVAKAAADSDVAHVHLCRDFLTTQAVRILSRHRIPLVAQSHGMLTRPRDITHKVFDWALLRRVLPSSGAYLTLTRREDDELLTLGVPAGRIRSIHNAVVDPGVRWLDEAQLPQFVFASRLHERKQPQVFLQAALRLLEDGYRAKFSIIGPDQGELGVLRQLAAASDHSDDIQIVGPVEHDELMKMLAEATAFVLPSKDEPYPMSAIECAAIGTPMILTREVGFAELLEETSAAILVEPSVGPVADAMRLMICDPILRARLSAASRSVYENHWQPEALARDLLQVYRGLIGSAGDLIQAGE